MIAPPENTMRRDFPLCGVPPILTGPLDVWLVNRPAPTTLVICATVGLVAALCSPFHSLCAAIKRKIPRHRGRVISQEFLYAARNSP
jgi:hypothetical protein